MGKGEERSSLGIAYSDIKNFNLSNGQLYEYDICVIRKRIINTTTKKERKRNNKNRNNKQLLLIWQVIKSKSQERMERL